MRLVLPVLFAFIWTEKAWAYVDPGTTSAVFSGIGYFIGMIAVAAGFLFRPIRMFLVWVQRKFRSDRNQTAA